MKIRERLMACYKSMYQALFFSLSSQRSKGAKKKTNNNKKNKTTKKKRQKKINKS